MGNVLCRLNGRFLSLSQRQVTDALERKVQLAKWGDTVKEEMKRLHPGLGQTSNQFAGWQGRRKTLIGG